MLVLFLMHGQIIMTAQALAVQWNKSIGGSSEDVLFSLLLTADGGYILGGYSWSNISGDKTESSKGSNDYWVVKLDFAGNKIWDKTIGGNGNDALMSLQPTADGGYILSGSSSSNISGDKTENSKGFTDFWLVKLDAAGNKVWDKTIGGSSDDILNSAFPTSDGGYILGGYSNSNISGDKTENSRGFYDYWVVKLDAAGNKVWDKTIGASMFDLLYSVRPTADGAYILGGWTPSNISGDKTENSEGGFDYWIVKLDAAGNKIWDKTIGGSGDDYLYSLEATADGEYILGGYSGSNISGDKTEDSKGAGDYWVVKLDAAGNKIWDKTIGGSDDDFLWSLYLTGDGGYILHGGSSSNISGDKTENSKGLYDYWMVKLDADGNKAWDKTIGGCE